MIFHPYPRVRPKYVQSTSKVCTLGVPQNVPRTRDILLRKRDVFCRTKTRTKYVLSWFFGMLQNESFFEHFRLSGALAWLWRVFKKGASTTCVQIGISFNVFEQILCLQGWYMISTCSYLEKHFFACPPWSPSTLPTHILKLFVSEPCCSKWASKHLCDTSRGRDGSEGKNKNAF